MSRRFLSMIVGIVFTGGLLLPVAAAQDAQQPAPDNTKANKRDRSSSEPTADQAKNGKSDRKIMQQIRRAVVKDKSLSGYGHNCKIIAEHGKVTLKGPVHTEDEKKAIEQIATKVAGEGNVTNELTVAGDQK